MTAHASQHPSVPALLSLEGEPFVRQAYRRLLNREADAAGVQACLSRLQSGMSKERILAELEASPEGRLAARRRGALAQPAAFGASVAAPRYRAIGPEPVEIAPELPHVDQLLAVTDDRSFILEAYQQLLGRPADAGGLAAFHAYMVSGASRAEVLRALSASDEGRAVNRQLPGLAELLRAAAAAAAPEAAQQPAAPVSAPVASVPAPLPVAELVAIAGVDDFLRAAYQQVLGREADAEGLEGCRRFLADGARRIDMLRVLAESDEGRAANRPVPGLKEALQAAAQPPAAPLAPPAAPQHVNELLDVARDADFLRRAYWHLFGREVDPSGESLYGGLLRQGWSRVYILRELVRSDEARQRGAVTPGLDRLLVRYAKAQQRSWTGWYFRQVMGAESDLPADRRLRVIYRHAIGEPT